MKIALAVLAGVGLVGAGVAAAQAAEAPDPAAAQKGRLIYTRYCGSCHGPDARGDGSLAADLKVPPADLTKLSLGNGGHFPYELVVRAIDGRQKTRGHGVPDMPVWGEVFPKTQGTESPSVESAVGRLAHYLWSIQQTAVK